MRDLEFQTVQDQLDRQIPQAAIAVKHEECLNRPAVASGTGVPGCRLDDAGDFVDRLNTVVTPGLGANRLLLLDAKMNVLYDSEDGSPAIGTQVPVVQSRRVANVGEARTSLGGHPYFASAVKVAPARDPLNATFVVIAQPQSVASAEAVGDLTMRLLEAGGAALVVAMLLILLVSQSVTRPLTQLAGAAEDIAAGNYARRVGIQGSDEIGMVGSAFNRMAEAVERARKVQREFLANVSHELKTPLTSLIGFSQALIDGSAMSEAERTQAATIVHEESERVLRMAQELLDLARVEAGSISLHTAAVDLGAQLEQELEIVRPRAAARDLKLDLNLTDDIPPVTADPERLHQVLDNLLDNAVKYAPEGTTVTLDVMLSGATVETVVANPAGAHRPDPDRMFERFYRADPSRSAAAGGVGLGLSISRELVSAMGGRLWADFDADGLLRVHLRLPAEPRPAAPQRVDTPTALPAARAV